MKLNTQSLAVVFGTIGLIALIQGMMIGSHVGQLANLTSFMTVFGLTILFSVQRCGFRSTCLGFLAIIFELKDKPSEFEDFNREIGSVSLISANISAVIGLVHVMSMLNDPAKIGDGIAVVLISYVYGMLLAGLLPVGVQSKVPSSNTGALLVPGLMLIAAFMTIMVAMRS